MGRSLALRIVGSGCAVALGLGYLHRADSDLTARAGLGYALGITGLAQMVLLLAYSLRKRLRLLRGVGVLSRWFELHMMLGLVAPTVLLFHCRFSLGSLNANVALFSTLFVAGSGIVGRFLYTRIHHGLLGERRTLDEMRGELRDAKGVLARGLALVTGLDDELDRHERYALRPTGSVAGSVARFLSLGPRTFVVRRRMRARLRARSRSLGADRAGSLRQALDAYIDSVFRAAILGSYEWLFGLWHAVHLPLCFLLFASAAVHVVAVHAY